MPTATSPAAVPPAAADERPAPGAGLASAPTAGVPTAGVPAEASVEATDATAPVMAAGDDVAAAQETTAFTLQQLHDGEVSAQRFTAFWDAALERIRSAPCPATVGAGVTLVVATIGATPPAHLGDAYGDYAPLVAEARAAAAATCE